MGIGGALMPLKKVPSNTVKICRVKLQGGGIPKIRGLGKDGDGVQPCILGMSQSTYGLKPEDNIHEEKVIMNLNTQIMII
jgi:hypothetical protein